MSDKITLYTFAPSPYGMKVYWALVFKGVPFDIVNMSPLNSAAIEFTGQTMVPVLKVGEEWRVDSTPLCQWLEELFPEPGYAGSTPEEKTRVLEADTWVTETMIAAFFRLLTDGGNPKWDRFRTGRSVARAMAKTAGGFPPGIDLLWWRFARRTPFVLEAAALSNRFETVEDLKLGVVRELEARLEKTGFIAGTERLSFADLSAFAQVVATEALAFKGFPDYVGSPIVRAWLSRIQGLLPANPDPELVPGLAIPRFG